MKLLGLFGIDLKSYYRSIFFFGAIITWRHPFPTEFSITDGKC